MAEVNRMIDLVQRAHNGEAWHGPSLGELLESVDETAATAHPLPGVHSILELVRHIVVWQNAAMRWLKGDVSYKVSDEEDWKTEIGENAWTDALAELKMSTDGLIATLSGMKDDELPHTPAGKWYTNYLMIHGCIQHTLYHAGQIAILRKFAAQSA